MPISARNRMADVVKAIEKGEVASTVKIEVAKPSVITAMIQKLRFKSILTEIRRIFKRPIWILE